MVGAADMVPPAPGCPDLSGEAPTPVGGDGQLCGTQRQRVAVKERDAGRLEWRLEVHTAPAAVAVLSTYATGIKPGMVSARVTRNPRCSRAWRNDVAVNRLDIG